MLTACPASKNLGSVSSLCYSLPNFVLEICQSNMRCPSEGQPSFDAGGSRVNDEIFVAILHPNAPELVAVGASRLAN